MSVAGAIVVSIRELRSDDRQRVAEIARATGLFREDEIAIAVEVFDGASAPGGGREVRPYGGCAADVDGRMVGWIAWGPTPCTVGTYDMYWLVVDPDMHGRGIGTALVEEMERRLVGVARLIVVETAGRPDYAGTRAFYDARGYRRTATIPDFYAPDDDLVVYVKSLTTLAR